MQKLFKILIVPFLVLFLCAGSAFAINFNDEITIYDNKIGSSSNSTYNAWWGNLDEDQEVEPGMQTGQLWDLEGFFYTGNTLSMVGGYNFAIGEGGFTTGDLFFDTNGLISNGNEGDSPNLQNSSGMPTYGYEYAMVLDFEINSNGDPTGAGDWLLYGATADSTTLSSYYNRNDSSNPWRIEQSSWERISQGDFSFGSIDVEGYFEGNSHYMVELILPEELQNFQYVHYTMQCGNDNMMGHTAPVPEPATMLLLGTGLIGIAGVGRKKIFKK